MIALCVAAAAFGQQAQITGSTATTENDSILPYVNIGIAGTPTGTISNSRGAFTLKLPESYNPDGMVTFSHIGYETQQYNIASLLNKQNRIALHPKAEVLEGVTLNLKAPKKRKLGRSATGLSLMHQNFYSASEAEIDDRLGKEMGMKLKLGGNCRVNALNFNITSNEFAAIKFRVNFYKVEGGVPAGLMFEEEITCEVKDGYLGWFAVDLKPYDLYLPKELGDVAVTIQWLESTKTTETGKFFALSTAMSPFDTFYYREKGMDKWLSFNSSLSFYLDVLKS